MIWSMERSSVAMVLLPQLGFCQASTINTFPLGRSVNPCSSVALVVLVDVTQLLGPLNSAVSDKQQLACRYLPLPRITLWASPMLGHPDGGAFETQLQGPKGMHVPYAPKFVQSWTPLLYSPPSIRMCLPLPGSNCELKNQGAYPGGSVPPELQVPLT